MRAVSTVCSVITLLITLTVALPAFSAQNQDAGRVISYAAWSPTTLYFAFRVDDPVIVGTQSLWLGQPWQDDAIAVYLDFGNGTEMSNNTLRVVISAAGGATVQRGGVGEWRDDPIWFDPLSPKGTIRYSVKLLDNGQLNDNNKPDHGYVVELGLSWELLGVRPPVRRAPQGQLPTIRFAVANYSQGETQSVSCWPENISENDLQNPASWGSLQFAQDLRPIATKDNTITATRLPGDVQIDSKLEANEWMTAGVIDFPKRWGETAVPQKRGRLAVSLITAWYSLDPYAANAPHQPFDVMGPWTGPDSPLYHTQQIREARRSGIDVFAVQLSTDPAQRDIMRRRLLALRTAEESYIAALKKDTLFDAPLLMPVIDLANNARIDSTAVSRVLDDFYRCIPPQFRVMVASDDQQSRYPVMLANPNQQFVNTDDALQVIADHLWQNYSIQPGWILDNAWKEKKSAPGVLSCCNFDPTAGLQLGTGQLLTTVVAPGVATSARELLPRRNGETFNNSWYKIYSARPDMVIIRSWNDFRNGTEVVASQTEGSLYLDNLRLNTLRLAHERGFGLCVLQHNLPARAIAGRSYPVDVLIKNGSIANIVTSKGFRIDYSITHNDETVLTGDVEDRVLLVELTAARLHLTLSTMKDRKPFAPGDYQLQLSIRRSKIPYVDTSLLQENLGTLTIPFTVVDRDSSPQVVSADIPEAVVVKKPAKVSLQVRNTSSRAWKKGEASFRCYWRGENGETMPGDTVLTCKGMVASGGLATVQGALPDAPASPGFFQLLVDYRRGGANPVTIYHAQVNVQSADACVQFLDIQRPEAVNSDKPFDVALLVKNCGSMPWQRDTTVVTYQWLTWDGLPIEGCAGRCPVPDDTAGGEKAFFYTHVTPPTLPGAFRCVFGIETAGKQAQVLADPVTVVVPMVTITVDSARYASVDLTKVFTAKDSAAYADTALSRGSFDDEGNAFPLEEFLPDMTNPPLGYRSGYHTEKVIAGCPYFRFGAIHDDQAPVVRATGQEIPMTKQPGKAVYLVAACSGDTHPATFTVRYDDDSTQSTTIAVANWMGSPVKMEPVMLTTRHLHTREGDNWYLHGSLFVYKIPLDSSRKPAALVLPDSSDIGIFAVTEELDQNP
ncbi:MAG TPA: sugar-binding protein [Armatimonadota bacterium]|nr:sugar-binding protein [Armatimonadota bacterium]